jgi:hypothetical protein
MSDKQFLVHHFASSSTSQSGFDGNTISVVHLICFLSLEYLYCPLAHYLVHHEMAENAEEHISRIARYPHYGILQHGPSQSRPSVIRWRNKKSAPAAA